MAKLRTRKEKQERQERLDFLLKEANDLIAALKGVHKDIKQLGSV